VRRPFTFKPNSVSGETQGLRIGGGTEDFALVLAKALDSAGDIADMV
jgi:hypothetical protein